MHRNDLLARLERHISDDEQEAESLRRIVSFVHAHPGCFDRALTVGHVTASAWLIDATGRSVLLTHHRKLGMWLQLGGHADGESDLLAAAIREAKEESGLADIQAVSPDVFDIDVHAIPPHGSDAAHDHYDVRFLLRSDGPGECRVSDESIDLRWFTAEELRELPVDNSVRRMARRWNNWLARRNELPPEDGRSDGSIHRIGSQNG